MTPDGTYPMPAHGWTCFHCGETFTKPGLAREHFGVTPKATPECWSDPELLKSLRKVEAERDEARVQVGKMIEGYIESDSWSPT